jgi:hypothetical protein
MILPAIALAVGAKLAIGYLATQATFALAETAIEVGATSWAGGEVSAGSAAETFGKNFAINVATGGIVTKAKLASRVGLYALRQGIEIGGDTAFDVGWRGQDFRSSLAINTAGSLIGEAAGRVAILGASRALSRGSIDDVLRAGKNAGAPAKASGLFHGASDDVVKYWDDYYRAVGSHGDDLTAATARLRQLGFDIRSGEAAALVKGTNVIKYGPSTKTWELYEEAIHHSVQGGLGTQEIAALTKELRTSFWQRSIRSASPADAAEEIFVKSQLLRRLDLDAPTRTLLGQQIEKLRLRGMNGGY